MNEETPIQRRRRLDTERQRRFRSKKRVQNLETHDSKFQRNFPEQSESRQNADAASHKSGHDSRDVIRDKEETPIQKRRRLNNERQRRWRSKKLVQNLEANNSECQRESPKQSESRQNADAASHGSVREQRSLSNQTSSLVQDDSECHDSNDAIMDQEETPIQRRRRLNNERKKRWRAKQVQHLEAHNAKIQGEAPEQSQSKQNADVTSCTPIKRYEILWTEPSGVLSTNVPTVINLVTPTSASQICQTPASKLEMDKRKLESEKSSTSNGIQRQNGNLLNEKTIRKLGEILVKVSQGQKVLVVPFKQGTKEVTGTTALDKISQNINRVSSSLPLATNIIQESSNSFQDSNITVVSHQNQFGVKSFLKRSDVIKDINTSLRTVNTVKDCSTTSIASHDSYTQPLVSKTFQDLSIMQEFSNAAQSSVAADKVHQSSTFVDKVKETSQPVPDFCASQNESLKTVSKETKISGWDIIEFDYLFKMFKLVNQHSKSGCNLNDIIITKKIKVGLRTYYSLKCTVCDYKINLCSENRTLEDSINADAIEGMLNINCNLDDMNKLLLNMKLSQISSNVFVKEYNKKERDSPKENFPMVRSITSENFGKSLEHRSQNTAFQVSAFSMKTYSKTAKESRENLTQKPKLFTDLISDSSGLDKSFEQLLSNKVLVVEDQFEVKEERNYTGCGDKSEVMLSQHILKVPNNKPVGDEHHTPLNTTKIKQEIDLDISKPEINQEEMLNNDEELIGMLSHQKEIGASNNKLVTNKDQIKLYKTFVKKKIQDNNCFLEPGDIDTEYQDKFEMALNQHILKMPNNKPVSSKNHTLLNTTRIKQEMDLDMHEKELDKSKSNKDNKFTDLILDSSGLCKNFELSNGVFVVEDQFEVEEERSDTACEDEPEVILPHPILKVPNNKSVCGGDCTLLNTAQIKQEIDLDMYEEKLDKAKNNKEEILHTDNLGYNDQFKGLLSPQKQTGACNNKLVDDNNFHKPSDIETAYKKKHG